jgi:hypothetical protein
MFGTRQIQNGVIDGDQEVSGLTAESPRERRLTEVLDEPFANQIPELPRRDPDTSAPTDDFRGSFAGAGQSSTSCIGPDGNLLAENDEF